MCLDIIRKKKRHFRKRLLFIKQCAKMSIINRNNERKAFQKVLKHSHTKYTSFTAYKVNFYELQMKIPKNQSVKSKIWLLWLLNQFTACAPIKHDVTVPDFKIINNSIPRVSNKHKNKNWNRFLIPAPSW